MTGVPVFKLQSNVVIALLVSEYSPFVSQLYAYLVAQKENCAFGFVCSAGNIQYHFRTDPLT